VVRPGAPLIGALLPRCRFPKAGTAVVCAVSGGADSLALLALASAAGLQVAVVHVDHGLRAGSAAEAATVAHAAQRFGATFDGRRVPVPPGPNLEARARRARYEALPSGVLTGHTADDQAETVLLNLLRGAGADGLAGMRAGGRVCRPLLGLRRTETRALCDELRLVVVDDPSNTDPRMRRNRIRHQLLPVLAELGGRDPVPILIRQARLLAADAAVLDELAGELDPTDARALAGAPPALARRAVRQWLRAGSGEERHPPSAAEVERVLAVAGGRAVACQLAGGREVRRSAGRLRLAPAPAASAQGGGLPGRGMPSVPATGVASAGGPAGPPSQ
jgi:tRNA(Ile)-lysidine synthase